MFETLRRMIFPIIIIVLFFFVGMIVLQWGLGMSSRSGFVDANTAAVINGEEVEWIDYRRIYDGLYQTELAGSEEGEVSDQKVRELQGQAWSQLLFDRLLMQQVANRNLTVTDEELYGYLRSSPPADLQQLPYFQTDGKFDYQKYVGSMADPSAAPFWASVEEYVSRDIMKMKVQELVSQAAHVTEAEVRQKYLGGNEKVTVEMINVSYARFSRPPPKSSDEEIREFFNERSEDYQIDARVSLNLVIMEKKPTPYDYEVSYNKAKAIYDSVIADADFALMAERYSEDPGSAALGGDLGWFARGRMVDEFDRKAFLMKEGDISEPIRTDYGWHIIKHFGYKEEMETPRGKTEEELVKKAKASHILIKAVLMPETRDRLYSNLEEFRTVAAKSGFLKAAADFELPVKTAGLFFRGKNIQHLGRDQKASDFAFENELDAVSEVIENDRLFYVAQVFEKSPAGQARYEDVDGKLKLDIVKWKVQTLCRDTAAAIYAELQSGTEFETAAKNNGEEVDTSEPFARTSFVKGLRRDPNAIGAAFSLKEPGQFTPPVDYDQGTVILRLVERSSPDLSDFNSRRDSLYNDLLLVKQQELFGQWFQGLVDNSEIINNIQKTLEADSIYM